MECLFSRRVCRPVVDPHISQLRNTNVMEFIIKVCSMCIKKQYANSKERLSRKKYMVMNTL